MPIIIRAVAAAALALLVAIAGCTSTRHNGAGPAEPTQDASADTSARSDSVVVTRTAKFRPDVVAAGKEKQGSGDQVVVGFAGLAVHGKLTVLTLTYTPEFSSAAKTEEFSLFEMFDEHNAEPTLVDTENLKRYSVATGRGGVSLGPDAVTTATTNYRTIAVNYTFAMPAIEAVDIYLDDMSLFDKVEVER